MRSLRPLSDAMYTRVSELSAFVLALNEHAGSHNVSELMANAVSELAEILGFDSAWYGWAQIDPQNTVIHANSTFNLPDTYYDVWTGMAEQDVLVDQFLENPKSVPVYDRSGNTQTDGMEFLADRFGLSKLATAMCMRNGRTASFYLSAYRSGRNARAWTYEDREFLQCAVDNIAAVSRAAAIKDLLARDDRSVSVIFSRQGAVLVGLANMRERFGHLWSRNDGDMLPRWLADYADEPGEHLLPDEKLVVRCEPVAGNGGMGWRKLSLRPFQKIDLLTPRERDVARALANGQSHKMVAKLLGVSPATVRNQTQAIYKKLDIDNRASLAQHVFQKVSADL